MRKLLLLLLALTSSTFAQEKVLDLFTATTVDDPSIAKSQTADFVKTLPSAQLLKISITKSLSLKSVEKSYLIDVPTKNGVLNLAIEPADILAPGFKVMTPTGEAKVVKPTFYKGRIIGKEKSFVALTITSEGSIEGMIQDGDVGLTIGKIKDNKDNLHIVYASNDIKNETPTESMPPVEIKIDKKNFKESSEKSEVSGCRALTVYLEADFKMYTDWGSNTTTVTNTMTAIFNQVAILYANEAVKLQLSQLFIWTTTDPYAGSANNTSSALTALDNYWNTQGNNFNGNICHMVTTRSLGGGIAYLYTGGPPSVYSGMSQRSVFYGCGKADALGLSANITNSVVNVPTYSWNVEVIAHEIGHNCGLPHTQSCTWPGGALDNCVGVEDGSCSPGPAPTNGGTIMSYCHLGSAGINFNNGFGLHPGSKLRAEIAAATCLGGSVPPAPTVTDGILCATGTTTLNVGNCSASGVTVNWYSTLTGTTPFHTGTSYTTPSLSASTDYFVDCSVSTTCVSVRKKISVNFVNGTPSPPTSTTGGTVCATGSSVVVSAVGCVTGSSYQWYDALTGGTLLFTGQNYTTPVLTATTNYYVACSVAGCGTSTRVAATVTYSGICPYCTPPATNCSDGDLITSVTIAQGVTNIYTNSTGCSSNGFSYTNISSSTTLVAGQTYALTLTNPGTYTEAIRGWIDYNKNGLFEDTEQIISKANGNFTTYSQSFSVPSLITGTYRMRLRVIYDEASPISPCADYEFGETEDYLISVSGINPCPSLLTLVSTADDQTTGTVTKQANATAGKITATNKITGTGTSAIYEASSVELNQGFSADSGTVFKVQVGGCN